MSDNESEIGATDRETAKSKRFHEDALSVFPGGVSHNVRYVDPYPTYIGRVDGPYVWDVDGNRYVDFWMNHGVSLLGHTHPEVVEAVADQARDGLHYGAPNEGTLELGRRLKEFIPSAERIRFCASGTEATMYAVRLARAATGRPHILKAKGGWHGGNTDLSVDVYPPFDAPTTDGLPPGAAEHAHAFEVNKEGSTADLLEKYRGEIAGVIIDPRRGGVPPTEEFLDFLEDAREEHGFLLIFDEVVTGLRVSPGSYQARVGVSPDLTTFGKIPGGGLPIGGLAGRAELFERARPDVEVDPHDRVLAGGGTFTANPMTAMAGLATLDVIETEPVYEHTESMGERVRAGLGKIVEEVGVDAEVLGISSLFYLAFNPEKPLRSPADVKTATDQEALSTFHERIADHGYYFLPGSMGAISYRTTAEHIDGFLDATRSVLDRMQSDGIV